MSKRKWAVVVVAVCLVVTAAAVAYAAGKAKAAVPQVVRAQKFELVDGQGKVRVSLSILADGAARLDMLDKDAKSRAALRLWPDGSPRLDMVDKDGKKRMMLGVMDDGRPGLTLTRGVRDRGGLVLGFTTPDIPSLALSSADGFVRTDLTVTPGGGARVTLYDEKGHVRAELGGTGSEGRESMGIQHRPESSLVLFDEEGTVLWQAP